MHTRAVRPALFPSPSLPFPLPLLRDVLAPFTATPVSYRYRSARGAKCTFRLVSEVASLIIPEVPEASSRSLENTISPNPGADRGARGIKNSLLWKDDPQRDPLCTILGAQGDE